MDTLYWITRLDGIVYALDFILLAVSLITIFLVLNTVSYVILAKEVPDRLRKHLTVSLIANILILTATVLTPTTKEAYAIYGVQNTLDSIKAIHTEKELPDRAVRALNLWMDREQLDNKNNKQ